MDVLYYCVTSLLPAVTQRKQLINIIVMFQNLDISVLYVPMSNCDKHQKAEISYLFHLCMVADYVTPWI
jgi:hypothetical protein